MLTQTKKETIEFLNQLLDKKSDVYIQFSLSDDEYNGVHMATTIHKKLTAESLHKEMKTGSYIYIYKRATFRDILIRIIKIKKRT